MATKKEDELGGLTSKDCPFDCSSERCVITGVGFCGHPTKGGLQAKFLNSPEVMDRYARARKILAHAKVDA